MVHTVSLVVARCPKCTRTSLKQKCKYCLENDPSVTPTRTCVSIAFCHLLYFLCFLFFAFSPLLSFICFLNLDVVPSLSFLCFFSLALLSLLSFLGFFSLLQSSVFEALFSDPCGTWAFPWLGEPAARSWGNLSGCTFSTPSNSVHRALCEKPFHKLGNWVASSAIARYVKTRSLAKA